MPALVTEPRLLIATILCTMGSAALSVLKPRWRQVEVGLSLLAVLCVAASIALSAVRRAAWPLGSKAEVIVATAAATILWHIVDRRMREPRMGVLAYVVAVGLLLWGVARWRGALPPPPLPGSSAALLAAAQQPWLLAARLALVLAWGALVEAGCLAAACLLLAHSDEPLALHESTLAVPKPAPLGLVFLTASLFLQGLGGAYTHGVYWSWSAVESWHLLVWLYYAATWCASSASTWVETRLRWLPIPGMLLTFLALRAVGA